MHRTQPYFSVRSAITRRKFRHRSTSAEKTLLLPLIRPGTITPARIRLRCLVPSLIQRVTEMPDLAAAFFADVAEPPATTSLRVDVPTLVLWGMQDRAMLPGQLDNLHDYAPNATVVRIEDGGHRPMQSHPLLVNRAIRDFLRRAPQ